MPSYDYYSYTGVNAEDTMDNYCSKIIELSKYYRGFFLDSADNTRNLTVEECLDMEQAKVCHMCKRSLELFVSGKFYPDIDKFSGKYYGTARYDYLESKNPENFFIPLVFHNARGYDLHHIVKHITQKKFGYS